MQAIKKIVRILRIKKNKAIRIMGLCICVGLLISDTTYTYAKSSFEYQITQVKKEYASLPSCITAKLKGYGVKIYLYKIKNATVGDEFTEVMGKSYNFIYSYNTKTGEIVNIDQKGYITLYLIDSLNYETGTVIHEIAHELDYIEGFENGYKGYMCGFSDSERWNELYNLEAGRYIKFDRMSKGNVGVSKSEGFAEAFRLYFLYPDQLKRFAPQTYLYIEEIVENYKGTNDIQP